MGLGPGNNNVILPNIGFIVGVVLFLGGFGVLTWLVASDERAFDREVGLDQDPDDMPLWHVMAILLVGWTLASVFGLLLLLF